MRCWQIRWARPNRRLKAKDLTGFGDLSGLEAHAASPPERRDGPHAHAVSKRSALASWSATAAARCRNHRRSCVRSRAQQPFVLQSFVQNALWRVFIRVRRCCIELTLPGSGSYLLMDIVKYRTQTRPLIRVQPPFPPMPPLCSRSFVSLLLVACISLGGMPRRSPD